ncbi:spermidine synthase spee [Helicobacter muridarum]|uniref:Spermidine synthase n=1 Tax=Helicobacter muridarum TaxID=216 RepID=A0A099TYM6_9HELI|nr:hypothetical protein [Helicobacter muridarum]TLD98897.1 spermidine synthase spee [Helicobacter muridarum]STQ87138.1 spermidine synthase [Helicobacter muridarum]
MWLNTSSSQNLQMQLTIHSKFADYKEDSVCVELFDSHVFGQIARIVYKDRSKHNEEVLIERFLHAQSEMLTYIPYCTRINIKRVLLFGTLNCQIAHLFANLGVEVDVVLPHIEAFHTLSGFLPNFKEIQANNKISFYPNFSSIKQSGYDIVLHLGELKAHEVQALHKLSSDDGIVIYRLENLYIEPNLALYSLDMVKPLFNILMPFVISCLDNSFYAFASKRFHPLADLLLQKSDMLDNVLFYNSNLHTSAFRMPTMIHNLILPCIKN